MCAIIDPLTDYRLPTLINYEHTLACACDMCLDPNSLIPSTSIGPHDLHCVCTNCCEFALNDAQYDEALSFRYPDVDASPGSDCFSPLLLDIAYTPPTQSPTNAEMHAYNGNSSWGDFLSAGARGAFGSNNPADRFAAGALVSSGLVGSSLLYTSYQNMATPLAELRQQFFPSGPTNKDMHTYNGNWDFWPIGTNVSDYYDVPEKHRRDRETHHDADMIPSIENFSHISGTGERLKKKVPVPPTQKPKPSKPGDSVKPTPGGRHKIDNKVIADEITHKLSTIHPELDAQPQDLPTLVQRFPEIAKDPEVQNLLKGVRSGPTNKEMHATNGNLKYGPITQKQHVRKIKKVEKRKVKRKLKKELRKWGPKNRPIAKAPRVSGAVKAAGKIESKEAKIARSYNKFLVDPCYAPPRLGSTGNYPTKMVHGYFKQTFLMSAPNWGTVPGLVNATSVLVALYPKMAPWNSTRLNLTGPFILAFADSDTVALNDATHGTIFAGNFSNSTALAGEVGSGVSARFMGGHCSLECRCPMMNVSPPYIYGGVLPRPPVINTENNATDMTAYLFNQSGSTVRNYPQSDDVQGFSVSTVYSPGASEDLNFFGNITNGDSGSGSLLCVPTPYCGMTSCPTTASVTVTISWWAEIQQNVTIAAYGGWKTGPKVSTEDVFDHLRRFNQIKPRALNQGVKSSDGRVNVPFVYPQINKQPEMTLEQKILLMEEKIKRLQLQIDDEEEEKFITTSPPDDSPRYVSLSRSTLDLLKDKLTPGSVTSKTARIQAA